MNKEWSELNKLVQKQLGNKINFNEGINSLLLLRKNLMKQVSEFEEKLTGEQLSAIPFINAAGYHSKTIAYSLYHIARIEDIVAHTLIQNDEEIFFVGEYQKRMNASVITTGNELIKQEIADFSEKLVYQELFLYFHDVYKSTNQLIMKLDYSDMKRRFSEEDKQRIRDKKVVSASEDAAWLVDYWCDKELRGLLKMPFSRHWIMHIEACLRISSKIM